MGIFRAYDIRGVYGKDLDEKIIEKIARASAVFLGGGRLVAACDVRPSSPSLKKSLVRALVENGAEVLDCGTIPTPLFYFSIVRSECGGGAMVTASHNPPEYNGVKVCGKKNGLVKKIGYDTGLAEIEKIVEKKGVVKKTAKKGSVTKKNITPDYEKHVLEKIRPRAPLRIGVDCGNGVAGSVAPGLFRRLGCEVHELYCEPDPAFPHHLPDPMREETLEDLKRLVRKEKLDLGIALDGDGDRVVFIDEKGNNVKSDVTLAVFAEKILEKKPRATFISEVKVSRGALERIRELGGKTIMWRVGHAPIHDKMKTTDAEAAGELSGHFYFRENYVNDDGLYAAAKMIEMVSEGKKLSELAGRVPKYFSTPEIRIHCPDEKKFSVVKKVSASLKKKYEVITVDGARVELPNAWGLVRASNTEPALTLRFEGKTEKDLKEVKGLIGSELARHGIKIP